MSYEIGVIGTGYVGLVSGVCFAETGNHVTCVDNNKEKIDILNNGECPIYEPMLDHMLERNIRADRVKFTTEIEPTVLNSEIIFLCLPTPPNEDGSADLHHVMDVAKTIAEIFKANNVNDRKILVNKSTVPVGTAAKVKAILDEVYPGHNVEVVSNPEFLSEGFAVEEAMKPERVVVGTSSEWVEEIMRDLYAPFLRSGNPIFFMDEKSAEVTKYAANAFMATKISFMNDLSNYCEKVGADIEKIRVGIGSDSRIGKRFLFAGIGYGGSCFPKDVRALAYAAEEAGTKLKIVTAAQEVNEAQVGHFFDIIMNKYKGDIKGKKFALWGLAFKPNTDDTREAPAFRLIDMLLEKGASVTGFDPEAMDNTKLRFGDKIKYADNMYDALEGNDALIIATEWSSFRNPNFKDLSKLLKENVIFDGRNLFEPDEMKAEGFEYYCVGRNAAFAGK